MTRKFGLLVVLGLMLALGTAGNAWAQGATLEITPSTATPDQVITITGSGFASSNANVGGVVLRLNTRESPQIATSSVDPAGRISATYIVPEGMAPGEYLVIGTQLTVRGRHAFGGPGRAKLRIVAAGGAGAGGRSPLEAPPAVLVAALLALISLSAGIAYSARRLRTARHAAGRNPLFSR